MMNYELQGEKPSEFASRLAEEASAKKHAAVKQKLGQYFTPVEAARMMAGFAENLTTGNYIKILDPGAGIALLSCALIEHIVMETSSRFSQLQEIDLVVFEIDKSIIPYTRLSLNYLKDWTAARGIRLKFALHEIDFIDEYKYVIQNNYLSGLSEIPGQFDIIISNPPYFKLHKDDPRAHAADKILSGHLNIYFIFIYISACLLKNNGELLFLIPRSFCSGNYFKEFRSKLLKLIKLEHIHLFSSKCNLFEQNSVSSEAVIVRGVKTNESKTIYALDVSYSESLRDKISFNYSYSFDAEKNIIYLPSSQAEKNVIDIVTSWKGSLNSLGFRISAGRLLKSKASAFMSGSSETTNNNYAAVLNLNGFSGYIKVCGETKDLLIPDRNYLLLRRYNTKYDDRRISAAAYIKDSSKDSLNNSGLIALDKQLLYAEKSESSSIDKDELPGIAAVLNSRLMDRYIKTAYGDINLSPDEIADLPLPPVEIIKETGRNLLNFDQLFSI